MTTSRALLRVSLLLLWALDRLVPQTTDGHCYWSLLAFELLGNASKRLAYDSVDPLGVDESIPTILEIKQDFFGCFNKVFIECAR